MGRLKNFLSKEYKKIRNSKFIKNTKKLEKNILNIAKKTLTDAKIVGQHIIKDVKIIEESGQKVISGTGNIFDNLGNVKNLLPYIGIGAAAFISFYYLKNKK